MTTYTFREVIVFADKHGTCQVCGKRAKRSRTFAQTISPFNTNPDGSVRSEREVLDAYRQKPLSGRASPSHTANVGASDDSHENQSHARRPGVADGLAVRRSRRRARGLRPGALAASES